MNLFDIGINILQNMIIYWFLANYLTMNKKYNIKIFFLFVAISTVVMSLSNLIIGFEGIYIYVFMLPCFIFTLLYSENDLIEKIFVNFLSYNIISLVANFLIIGTSLVFYGDIISPNLYSSQYFWLFTIIVNIVLFFAYALICKVRKKYNNIIIKSQIVVLFLLIIIVSFIQTTYGLLIHGSNHNEIVFLLGMLFLFVLLIGLYIAFISLLKLNKQITDSEVKLVVLESKLKQDGKIEEMNDKIIMIKNEMNNTLKTIDDMLDNNNYEKAQNIISKYDLSIKSVVSSKITNNNVLNHAINQLQESCDRLNIDCVFTISSLCNFNLGDNDLMIVLSNIFENAYENCKGDNKIRINIKDKNEYIIVRIENSIEVESIILNNDIKTSKLSKGHGYGINNTVDIMNHTNSKIQFESSNYLFVCKLLFKSEKDISIIDDILTAKNNII